MNRSRNLTLYSMAALALVTGYLVLTNNPTPTVDSPVIRELSLTLNLNLDSLQSASDATSESAPLEILFPLPLQTEAQELMEYSIESELMNLVHREIGETEYGNRALLFTLDNIHTISESELPITVTVRALRSAISSLSEAQESVKETKESLSRYLQPDKLVPIDGSILTEAKSVLSESSDDLTKMRELYDHLCETMQYDKSGDGWGFGDALYACDARKGNCTDIHSLFIALARASGVPARFVMGFPLPAAKTTQSPTKIAGYHCWAEFYIPEHGWIPVDISDAIKNPSKKEFYFGALDQNRIAFSKGRDISFAEANLQEPLNYFIYPVVSISQMEYSNSTFSITYRDYPTADLP